MMTRLLSAPWSCFGEELAAGDGPFLQERDRGHVSQRLDDGNVVVFEVLAVIGAEHVERPDGLGT
jgi:hypothetical protein